MLQAPLPPTRTDTPVQKIQRLSGDTTSEDVEMTVLQKCLCDGELTHQPDLQSGSPTMMCDLVCVQMTEHIRAVSGVAERADPVTAWQGRRRQEEPGQKQRCQDSETEGIASVV